jgi:hypothetical protein
VKRVAIVWAGALGFLLVSHKMLFAGVVMSETEMASGLLTNGAQHRTIYVQGNKQKVDTNGIQTITDLDKGLLYVIDKNRKAFVEIPLGSVTNSASGGNELYRKTVLLRRTGATRVVAANHCDEYSGNTGNDHVRVSVSACVSSKAPGVAEIARFRREMISRLQGVKPGSLANEPAAIVLEKQSVISIRMPAPLPHGHQFTSEVTRTRVDRIKIKALPARTFVPPKGYSKIERHPDISSPADVQSIVLKENRSMTAPSAFGVHSNI